MNRNKGWIQLPPIHLILDFVTIEGEGRGEKGFWKIDVVMCLLKGLFNNRSTPEPSKKQPAEPRFNAFRIPQPLAVPLLNIFAFFVHLYLPMYLEIDYSTVYMQLGVRRKYTPTLYAPWKINQLNRCGNVRVWWHPFFFFFLVMSL